VKSRLVLLFWYWLTRVVPEKGPLNGRVCVIQEKKGLRKMLRVSWTAKKTNEWVVNKAGVKKELLDTVKARKLAYYGHTMRCTQSMKATHGLDGQNQDEDRTLRGRVNQNDRGQG